MSKIVHYRSKCIGCGICYEQQPQLWRMSKKDGKATLIKGTSKKDVFISELPASELSRSREIAEACPVKIIKLT